MQAEAKTRICPQGNRYKEKDGIRKDSTAAQFLVIRLMLSLTALMGLKVGTIDISAAYLHLVQFSDRSSFDLRKSIMESGVQAKLL